MNNNTDEFYCPPGGAMSIEGNEVESGQCDIAGGYSSASIGRLRCECYRGVDEPGPSHQISCPMFRNPRMEPAALAALHRIESFIMTYGQNNVQSRTAKILRSQQAIEAMNDIAAVRSALENFLGIS
jgi:hypothetical protein